MFGALMFGAAARARAETVYYAGCINGSTWNFRTVNSGRERMRPSRRVSVFGGEPRKSWCLPPTAHFMGLTSVQAPVPGARLTLPRER